MFTWSGDLKGFGAAGKTFVVVVVVSTDAPFGKKKTKTDSFWNSCLCERRSDRQRFTEISFRYIEMLAHEYFYCSCI